MPIAKDEWSFLPTIDRISCELERIHLARSPLALEQLNNINESSHEMGNVKSFRLKQYYNGDV